MFKKKTILLYIATLFCTSWTVQLPLYSVHIEEKTIMLLSYWENKIIYCIISPNRIVKKSYILLSCVSEPKHIILPTYIVRKKKNYPLSAVSSKKLYNCCLAEQKKLSCFCLIEQKVSFCRLIQ